MKKKSILGKMSIGVVIAFVGILISSSGIYADPINVGDLIWIWDREGIVGEVGISKTSNPLDELFRSFCVERAESFAFGKPFRVDGITNRAIYGGVGPEGDPISPETAYLYTEFRRKTLSNYDYTPDTPEHIKDAISLQRALWYFESEYPYPDSDGQAKLWIAEAIGSGWIDIGSVRVMNLLWAVNYGSHRIDDRAQDFLVLVPEPGTLLLLGAGLLGLGFLARRKIKSI